MINLKFLYQDSHSITLADMLRVDISKDDVAFQAKIKAVLKTLPIAKAFSVVLIVAGFVLMAVIAFISITHIWEVIASIKPSSVADLSIPDDVLHNAALAFTIAFDIALVYFLLTNLLASIAGTSKSNVYPLLTLLGTLNALYIFKYFPGIDDYTRATVVGILTYVSAIALPIVFALTIWKIKASIEYCLAGYYAISIKQETLAAVLNTALVSTRTQSEQNTPVANEERIIKALADSGMKVSNIAKTMGGNYQKRIEQVKNILELNQNTLEPLENKAETM